MFGTGDISSIDLDHYERSGNNYRAFAFDNGTRLSAPGSILRKHKDVTELSALMLALKDGLGKFTFGETPRRIWKKKYKFAKSTPKGKTYLNMNSDSIERYVDQICNPLSVKEVYALIGDIGCGKSTFNKLIMSQFCDKFEAAGVIPTRIEFQKFMIARDAAIESNPNIAAIDMHTFFDAYVASCVMRDIVLHSRFNKSPDQDDNHFCPRQNADAVIESQELKLHIRRMGHEISDADFETYDQMFLRNHTQPSLPGSNLQKPILAGMIKQLTESQNDLQNFISSSVGFVESRLNKRFFIIYDGFDFIEVNDFSQDSPVRRVLEHICRQFEKGVHYQTPFMEISKLSIQLSLRETTYGLYFAKVKKYATVPIINDFHIGAPCMNEVIAGVIDIIDDATAKQTADPWSFITECLRHSVKAVCERLFQSSPVHASFDYYAIFGNNARHLLNFLTDVVERIIEEGERALSIRSREATTPAALGLECASIFENILKKRQGYKLVSSLLCSRSSRYKNFVTVNRIPSGELEIGNDNDFASGYIGNIFNYHMVYEDRHDIVNFIKKLRIMRYLQKENSNLSCEDIAAYISASQEKARIRGGAVEECNARHLTETQNCLSLMLRENFLTVKYSDTLGEPVYSLSQLGKIAIDNFAYETAYLEQVFFGCLIPRGLVDPETQDIDREKVSTRIWVRASLFNVVTILRLMRTACDQIADTSERKSFASYLDGIITRCGTAFQKSGSPNTIDYDDDDRATMLLSDEGHNMLLDRLKALP